MNTTHYACGHYDVKCPTPFYNYSHIDLQNHRVTLIFDLLTSESMLPNDYDEV